MRSLRISEAAERSGVPASTLRYYEKIGLLNAPRSESGYRVYDQPTCDRLAFVVTVKRLGLPLWQIRELLGVWDDQSCRVVQGRLRTLVDEQLVETRTRIAELQALEQQLVDGRERLDALPARETGCSRDCAFQHAPVPTS